MYRAVFVRTLKPGVSGEQFVEAWMPPGMTRDTYPSAVTISHNTANERQVMSTFDIDAAPGDLSAAIGSLVHPDSANSLAGIVESTEFEGVFEVGDSFGIVRPLG